MAKKRKDGLYQKFFTYEGKRYVVYASTKSELIDKVYEKKLQLMDRTTNRTNPTLNAYYDDFTELRRNKVKESTLRNQSNWFRWAADIDLGGITFGELRMKDIKPADLKKVQMHLIENKKLSASSINDCLHHVSHVFNEAVKDETIDRNPCKCLSAIKRTDPPARNTKHRALSVDETKLFIQTAADRNSFYINGFKLMLQTGIRMGELGALTAADADFDSGFLNINKTISRDEIGAYVINPTPKTDTSNRQILMNDTIKQIIKDQKALLLKCFGLRFNTVLFPSSEGELLRDYTFNREIKRITDQMGIDVITSHALRATFATRFIEQKPGDYKILSEILGHSDIKITLNLYAHVMEENKQQAMKELIIAM